MTLNTFFDTWKWPNRQTDTAISVFDIPQGMTTIDVPSALTANFRNFTFELLFNNVSPSDIDLTVNFYCANSIDGFTPPNVEALDLEVKLDSTNTNNSRAVFLREIKNVDNEHLRLIVNAPTTVTANMIINLKVGTNSR